MRLRLTGQPALDHVHPLLGLGEPLLRLPLDPERFALADVADDEDEGREGEKRNLTTSYLTTPFPAIIELEQHVAEAAAVRP